MYKSILVPVDGSSFAEAALPTAIHLARTNNARLTLLRVVERAIPTMLLNGPHADDSWRDAGLERAAEYLDMLAGGIERLTGIKASSIVVRGGIAAGIRKVARDCDAGLIVMNTRTHGPAGRIFSSSVADRVARSAQCAVLFVRAGEVNRNWNVHRRFMHVLVPLDGTKTAERALPHAIDIADADDAQLTILHVAQPALAAAGASMLPLATGAAATQHVEPEDVERMSHEYLASLMKWVAARRQAPFTDVRIQDGAPGDAIVKYAEANRIDLIAMTTRGLSSIRRLMLGSTASAVIRKTSAAILLLPPQAAR